MSKVLLMFLAMMLIFASGAYAQTCADVNNSGTVNISDMVYMFAEHLGGQPIPAGKGDIDFRQGYNAGDPRFLIEYIFRGGPVPGCPPFPPYSLVNTYDSLIMPCYTVPAGSGEFVLPICFINHMQVSDIVLPLRVKGLSGSVFFDSLHIESALNPGGSPHKMLWDDSTAVITFNTVVSHTSDIVPGVNLLASAFFHYTSSPGGTISMDTVTITPHTFPNYVYGSFANNTYSYDVGVPQVVPTSAPDIANCPDDSDLDACAVYTHNFDVALPSLFVNLVWSLVDPPAGASINAATGELTYDPPTDPAELGAHVITVVVTDGCGATDQCAFTITVMNDAPAITNCPDDLNLDACLVYTLQFTAEDQNACTDLVYSLVAPPTGAIITAAGLLTYDPPLDPAELGAHLIQVVVTDEFGATGSCEFTVTVFNTTPVFANCPLVALVMFGCTTLEYDFNATDPNMCAALVYSLVGTVPTGASIDGALGVFTYDPPDDLASGLQNFTVKATDEFGAFVECAFAVDVNADAPVFTVCPDPDAVNPVVWGETFYGFVLATDADAGPEALEYTLVSFSGPITAGPFLVNSTTGAFSWPTEYGNTAYSGVHQVSIMVSDGCKEAICNFDIHLTGMYAEIGKLHDVIQGRYAFVPINIFADGAPLGGFDLLIAYDASALTLHEVLRDPMGVTDTVFGAEVSYWEYFTYRFGATGNCNGACPTGLVKIVAIADMNNGYAHPEDIDPNNPYDVDGLVATLKFLVTSNRTYDCQFVPVAFYWTDCTDNVLSSPDGVTAYISHYVWWYTGDFPPEDVIRLDNNPHHDVWPGYGGWGSILEPDCLDGYNQKVPPLDWVDFYDGGIDIVCADSIDKRGDLNLNGIANEIADAVIYTQYFLIGIDAFSIGGDNGRQASIAASDVNADGKALSIGDLVYLLRVVVGDALPYPKLAPYSSNANISVVDNAISVESSETIGALYLTFDVTGDNFTVVNHTNMEVMSNRVGDKLNVLVYSGMSNLSNAISAGTNELLTVTGAQLNSVEASDYYGSLLNTRVAKSALPTQFALAQNIPNPFNPTTKIGLDLPSFTGWQIDIYNVSGQLVQSYNGTNIGHVEVTWDAANSASGIYFYKVTAGSFTDTKKMVLMK